MTSTEHVLTFAADAVVRLADLSLAFGRIERTAVQHPTGEPESDTDHTVMLGLVACALAQRHNASLLAPGRPANAAELMLDLGLVAQFALVHDFVEVYAGDTQTLRITSEERAAKKVREHDALVRITTEFYAAMPWLPRTIVDYENQELPEARFVRGLDKLLPKAVHLIVAGRGLTEFGMGRTELAGVLAEQYADMLTYVGEFTELMGLHAELAEATLALLTVGAA